MFETWSIPEKFEFQAKKRPESGGTPSALPEPLSRSYAPGSLRDQICFRSHKSSLQ